MTAARVPIAAILLTCLILLGGIVTIFRDYGITWDEGVQSRYGELTLDYFGSGFTDRSYEELHDLKYYGALFEMVCSAVYRLAGTDPYATRHLLCAITGLLTIVAVVLFGRFWRDPWISVYAGAALVMIPRFFGHSFTNSKDIPFACAFAWAMLAIAWAARAPRPTLRQAIVVGLAIGMTLSVRMGGLLLFGFAALAFLATLFADRARGDFARSRSIARLAPVAIAISWAVMVAAWPWAQSDVVRHPILAFFRNLNFQLLKEILYRGEIVFSNDIPRSYLPWYLLITIPLPLVALGAFGVAACARRALDRSCESATPRLLLLSWLFVPVGSFVLLRPTVYDGIRHFLFLLPAVALLAALGGSWIRNRFAADGRRLAVTLLVLGGILWPVQDMVTLHPYQSAYFNGLVGGVGGASGRYDTEYWASSYREAALWLNRQAERSAGRPLRVLVAGNELALPCIRHFSLASVQMRMVNRSGIQDPLPPTVDYYVALTRRRFDENYPEAVVRHTVGRSDAVFTVIKGHAKRGTSR